MKNIKKRLLSTLLALLLLLSIAPVSVGATQGQPMTVRVSEVQGLAGATVDVMVFLENNPGLASFKARVAFDSSLVTLERVEYNTGLGGQSNQPQTLQNPVTLTWVNHFGECTLDTVFATLTFSISGTAEEGASSPIVLTVDPDDVYDGNEDNVNVSVVNGNVCVSKLVPGDINGDGSRNNKDLTRMFQYLANWNVEVNEPIILDTNGDGMINNKDLTRLFQFLADWDVELHPLVGPDSQNCNHMLVAHARVEPMEMNPGNIAYWQCSICGKYYFDANASREITLAETVIPPTGSQPEEPNGRYEITYDIANGDPYLEQLLARDQIVNSNQTRFSGETEIPLKTVSVPGYRFLGWFDGAGNNAIQIRSIPAGAARDYELFAHWEKIQYTIQFKSSLYLEESRKTYTVDEGTVLPTPMLSNYVFTGWTDDNGNLYSGTTIPVGTTGHITLNANWTSERNKTWSKPSLDAPIILEVENENEKVILFAYEIGRIENVPVSIIKDFGYIGENGVTKTESATYSKTVNVDLMKSFTKTVANSTTNSSNWELSSDWNNTMSINEQAALERGYTKEEAESIARNNSSNWNISSGTSGTVSTTHLETDQNNWERSAKIGVSWQKSHEHEVGDKEIKKSSSHIEGNLTYTPKNYSVGVKVADTGVDVGSGGGWGGGINIGKSKERTSEHWETDKDTTTRGLDIEVAGKDSGSSLVSNSATASSSWNSSESYGGSQSIGTSSSISTALSERISQVTGYGSSYSTGGSSSSNQGLSSTTSDSDEYTSSVTYSTQTYESITQSWTTSGTRAGYHRWIYVGKAHVFAVVAYDMESGAFSVFTYSMMDDSPLQPFEDYSYTTGSYDDHENGVLPFSIPFEVAEYVMERTSASDGLKVDQNTGIITGYNGTDNCVVIPEYYHVGNAVVKVTGISATAFRGNTGIEAVILSDFISVIPDGAFQGCTNLKSVRGSGIREIGANAFAGCTSMQDALVSGEIISLGTNAFSGVDGLFVNASNSSVAVAAGVAGAKKTALYLDALKGTALDGKTITVPETAEYFEIYGYGMNCTDTVINSEADKTVLNRLSLIGGNRIPLTLSSVGVVLNNVAISSQGIGLVLANPSTDLGLQGTIQVSSASGNAVLSRNLSLYESNNRVDGLLEVEENLLIAGSILSGEEFFRGKKDDSLSEEQFYNMQHSYTLNFDANGGSCAETSRQVANGVALGTLPTPTRQYYTFTGWYLVNGTPVTESTAFSSGLDQTIYAHWSPNSFTVTFNANGGTCSTPSKKVTYGTAVGTLPTPTRDYYKFLGWTLSDGTKISASTVFPGDSAVTIYATWELNPLKGWVLASAVPSGAQTVEQKWTYTLRTNTESRETSLSGYTQYDSYWVPSGSGSANFATFPSGFDTNHWIYTSFYKSNPFSADETTTSKREVSTQKTGYVYYKWDYNAAYANRTDRAISPVRLSSGTGGYAYYYFHANLSSTAHPYLDNYYCNSYNLPSYNCSSEFNNSDLAGTTPRFFRFDYYTAYYADYYKMFKYYKTEQKESSSIVSESSTISDVQHWVKYREK